MAGPSLVKFRIPSLAVDPRGTELSYTDSGPPPTRTAPGAHATPYTTIFAFHAMGFNAGIFAKLHPLAPSQNLRIVGVNRRGYSSSTPLTPSQAARPISGTDAQKTQHIVEGGAEAAAFIRAFVQKFDLPPRAPDGRGGGFAVLGWGSGCGIAMAAVRSMGLCTVVGGRAISVEEREWWAQQMRVLILQANSFARVPAFSRRYAEPPSITLGLDPPSASWSAHLDPSIPPPLQTPFHTSWVTSYFAHPGFARSHSSPTTSHPPTESSVPPLEYIVPSPHRRPTIYALTAAERAAIVEDRMNEEPAHFGSTEQIGAVFQSIVWEAAGARVRVAMICGTESAAEGIAGVFGAKAALEKVAADPSAASMKFDLVEGVNHFMVWDDPEKAISAYLRALED
ncbi:hypothetical protein FA95DRAFT_1577247 [Auriscalpium vulgare]|uniref:Uncharacterized protein n=1 Tax=Auriscalpium vulgare TaxID=40419 RepID=A0ACB8R7V3_9AGAM|nr:hypothetical protein FA95DRAFT_1577247 [Auriscalpium vulgare]